MTAPSSSRRPEHTPRPGVTWETELVRTEQVVDDSDTTVPGVNEPAPPRPNRATRRAIKRATRRKTK